jgi:hypothetical protein
LNEEPQSAHLNVPLASDINRPFATKDIAVSEICSLYFGEMYLSVETPLSSGPSSLQIRFSKNGIIRKIKHQFEDGVPDKLTEVEEKINEILSTEQWYLRDDDHWLKGCDNRVKCAVINKQKK